jgi:hypothetical protein
MIGFEKKLYFGEANLWLEKLITKVEDAFQTFVNILITPSLKTS